MLLVRVVVDLFDYLAINFVPKRADLTNCLVEHISKEAIIHFVAIDKLSDLCTAVKE